MNQSWIDEPGADDCPRSLQFSDVDLSTTILDATRLLECGVGRARLTLFIDFPGAPLVVEADARSLTAVIRRIFHATNIALERRFAVTASDGTSGDPRTAGCVVVRACTSGTRARIVFVHNGEMVDLRDAFSCVLHADTLAVLDIAIIRATIERQGGSFVVDQVEGQTRMTLELPRGRAWMTDPGNDARAPMPG